MKTNPRRPYWFLLFLMLPMVAMAQISVTQPSLVTGGQIRTALGMGEQTATITTGTAAIDVSLGNQILITGTSANTVVTFSNLAAGQSYRLIANSGTFNAPTITFPAGTTQSLSGTNIYTLTGTGSARVDVIPFIYSGTTIRILEASPYYTP